MLIARTKVASHHKAARLTLRQKTALALADALGEILPLGKNIQPGTESLLYRFTALRIE
jgi:hypothetical protein